MLAIANVPKALFDDVDLEEELLLLLEVSALATAKVVRGLLLFSTLPDPPFDLLAALTANSVLAGLLPIELKTSASVVETWLEDRASAARGFTFPLTTPESSTAFLRLLLLLLLWLS